MRHTGIDGVSLDSALPQVVHLILHQSYERRNHKADAVGNQCGHLKRNALPAARRHKPERVVPRRDALNYLSLNPAKVFITPIFA